VLPSIKLRADRERITLSIEADRFLYRMVRTIVGTLMHLNGRGELSSRAVAAILRERRHGVATVAAPPQGLFLTGVGYGPVDLPEVSPPR
jgi:tRNA pseudouridine38-40 synthase